MKLEEFSFFSDGHQLEKEVYLDGNLTKIDFLTDFSGITTKDKVEKGFEGLGITIHNSENINKKYSKRRKLEFRFTGGKIEHVSLVANIKTASNQWYRSEDIFNIKDVIKEDDLTLIVYKKQANFLKKNLVQYNFNNKEEGLQFVEFITLIGVGYATQILEQLENSESNDDKILCSKLERVVSADHQFQILRSNYVCEEKSEPMRNRSMSYRELLNKLERFGVKAKKL